MKRRDFLHLAIATMAIGGARPFVARGQQTADRVQRPHPGRDHRLRLEG